jgi:hypothetical protein
MLSKKEITIIVTVIIVIVGIGFVVMNTDQHPQKGDIYKDVSEPHEPRIRIIKIENNGMKDGQKDRIWYYDYEHDLKYGLHKDQVLRMIETKYKLVKSG